VANRRSFVPGNLAALTLESREAPSAGSWLSHQFTDLKRRLTPQHHSHNAAAGIQQMWKDNVKLSRPHHVATPHHAAPVK
jgi:hypothetical protein